MVNNDKVLSEARRLHALGFAILWLHERSKRPVGKAWTSGPKKSWKELKATYKPGFNVGVRLGEASKIGEHQYLACIDVDVKNVDYANEAITALRGIVGGKKLSSFAKVQSGSGNDSSHYYFLTSCPFKMITAVKNKNYEICIYSSGRQMVLPPSIHPDTGKEYAWIGDLTTLHVADEIIDIGSVKTEKKEKDIIYEANDEINHIEWEPFVSDETKLLIKSGIWKGEHIHDRSAYLQLAASHLLRAGLSQDEVLNVLANGDYVLGRCAHDHVNGRGLKAARAWLWKYSIAKVVEERKPENVFKKVEVTDDWRNKLERSKGRMVDSLKNLDIILSNITPTALFQRNEFTIREVYATDAPWGAKAGTDIQDIDIVLIKSWLADSEFGYEPKKQNLEDAVSLVSHRNRIHPIRDYLNGLIWDGKPRIRTWIRNYLCGEAAEPYLSEISSKFLIAMVARVFEPGCQWDYTPILEGEQGSGKSTAARILASDAWFCDHLPDLKDKDAMLNLQGSWLVELAELRNVKSSDISTVKAFLTRRIDRVRAPYGKRWVDTLRQSVFIGTVNENEYFKDPTGNRRFWPVTVGQCDTKALIRDRDQLFAEAKHYYASGKTKLYLEDEALEQALEAEDDRRIDDDAMEMRAALLEWVEKNRQEDRDENVIIDLNRFKIRELFETPQAPWSRWVGKPYILQTGAQVLRSLKFIRTMIRGQRIWRQKSCGEGADRGADPLLYAPPDFF